MSTGHGSNRHVNVTRWNRKVYVGYITPTVQFPSENIDAYTEPSTTIIIGTLSTVRKIKYYRNFRQFCHLLSCFCPVLKIAQRPLLHQLVKIFSTNFFCNTRVHVAGMANIKFYPAKIFMYMVYSAPKNQYLVLPQKDNVIHQ